MPHGWTRVASPEELKKLLGKPEMFERKASELVEEAGAVLEHIFWEESGKVAYIVSCVPAKNADAIFKALNARIGRTKRVYDGEELRRALRRAK
jgi:hypothetical protein